MAQLGSTVVFGDLKVTNDATIKGKALVTGDITGNKIVSTQATGVSPLLVTSTTKVTNLNVDRLDDQEGSYYLDWNNATNKPVNATGSVAGFMAAADFTKLAGIAAGAQVNVGTNIAQGTRTTTTVPVTSSTGTGTTLDIATTSLAGVMSSADKTKLDGVAAGAQVNPTFTATATDIKMNGAQAVGVLTTIARADHVHPTDTTRGTSNLVVADLSGTAMTSGGTAVVGVATTAARSDHKHAFSNPAIDTLAAATDTTTLNATTSAHGLLVKATAPAATMINVVAIGNAETAYTNKSLFDATVPVVNGTAATGSAVVAARRDHVHPTDGTRQPLGNELTALQALADTAGFLKKTGDGTYAIDTATYNNYSHPTGDGNLHVPATSTTNSGKVLTAGATAGTFTWEASASSMSFTATATDIKMNGTQAVGVLTTAPRADHVHPIDTSRAPIASPTFTGVATAPTFQSGSYQIVYNATETSLDFMYTG